MPKKKLFLSFIFVFLFLPFAFSTIGAQSDLTEIAISVSVNDDNVQNAQIICSDTNGYTLCKNEYDSSMYGVINDKPPAAIQIGNLKNSHLVISKGDVIVKVSSSNGNIKTGDFVTASTTPGVAKLATKSGYVLGTALEDYSSDDPNAVGQIKVATNIHARVDFLANATENLVDLLRSGISALSVGPIAALRYIVASLLVILSFLIGFIYFGRIAKTGVEAIGRNPLAGARIQLTVFANILIMIVIAGVGLAAAYLILIL